MLLISCFPALSEPLETSLHVRHTWDMQAQEAALLFVSPPWGRSRGKKETGDGWDFITGSQLSLGM